jgi:hypothetical protein
VDSIDDFSDMEAKLREAMNQDNARNLTLFCEKLSELRELLTRVDYIQETDTNG